MGVLQSPTGSVKSHEPYVYFNVCTWRHARKEGGQILMHVFVCAAGMSAVPIRLLHWVLLCTDHYYDLHTFYLYNYTYIDLYVL